MKKSREDSINYLGILVLFGLFFFLTPVISGNSGTHQLKENTTATISSIKIDASAVSVKAPDLNPNLKLFASILEKSFQLNSTTSTQLWLTSAKEHRQFVQLKKTNLSIRPILIGKLFYPLVIPDNSEPLS